MVASSSHTSSTAPKARVSGAPALRAAISGQEALHDFELVRRFNGGDEAAFVEMVTRYNGKIFSVVLRHLRNHADAEEITQDTFIRAHRGLARFRGDSSFATWLHRIAFNLSRNRYKYYFCRRRHASVSLDCSFSDENSTTLSDLIASDAPSPAREASAGEFSELVVACMAKLGTRQREILTMRNGMNQSYGDIAMALGISIGTVKSRIGRARRNLRTLIDQAYPESTPGGSPFDWFETIRPSGGVGVACV